MPLSEIFLIWSLVKAGALIFWLVPGRGGGRLAGASREGDGQDVTCHRHIRSADVDYGVEIFEALEFDFHVAIILAELFDEHLAQILRRGPRFASCRQSFDGNNDSLVILENAAFDGSQLCIGRDTAGDLLQERGPEETIVDVLIQDTGRLNDIGQFGGTLLRCRHGRLDLGPLAFDRAQLGLDLERAVSVPHVIKKKHATQRDQDHYADLERVALALPLLKNFLVQEV